ncbi:hypothetical protein AA0119_g7933 [Alternaria tenuissima]|uniref:Uncharacterized protein n=1 Tax=Alternaria tenuissima TaxID=119927 RepID=A0ABY0G4C6_9PLEO|nr:hypothetical protein AA0119_g7933 [Alternaria tenuissima]
MSLSLALSLYLDLNVLSDCRLDEVMTLDQMPNCSKLCKYVMYGSLKPSIL